MQSSTGASTPVDSQGFTPTPSAPATPPPISAQKAEQLVWESSSRPERSDWSNALLQYVDERFDLLDEADDIADFCPPYARLTRPERVNAWANLIASVTYYESAWNPTSNSVDVGNASDRDTWSVGLLQLSVVDQVSYGFQFGYAFADLQKPLPNLRLGVAILARQVSHYGLIAIPTGHSGLYWAVLHPGGKYDQSANIKKMTQKIALCGV
jgi:hypothetical protein